MEKCFLTRILAIGATVCSLFVSSVPASADQVIYDDAVANGWENWSWATVNFDNTATVHGGSKSISASGTAWAALYWGRNSLQSSTPYNNLSFWINGGP